MSVIAPSVVPTSCAAVPFDFDPDAIADGLRDRQSRRSVTGESTVLFAAGDGELRRAVRRAAVGGADGERALRGGERRRSRRRGGRRRTSGCAAGGAER